MGWCVSAKVLPFRVKFRSRDVFGRGGARGAVHRCRCRTGAGSESVIEFLFGKCCAVVDDTNNPQLHSRYRIGDAVMFHGTHFIP